jgi:hypothetical protein
MYTYIFYIQIFGWILNGIHGILFPSMALEEKLVEAWYPPTFVQ